MSGPECSPVGEARFPKERLSRSPASEQPDAGREALRWAPGTLVILTKASSLGSWGVPRRGGTGGTEGCDGREMGLQEKRRQDSRPRQKAGSRQEFAAGEGRGKMRL